MNNSIIKLNKIHFNADTIEELKKFARTNRIELTYYYGYIVDFDKTNIHAISPHKIIFSKYDYDLLVLHYDDYHKNYNLFIIVGENELFTITSMKKYIRQYFSIR